MLGALQVELGRVGLSLNAKKTKLFTNAERAPGEDVPCYVEVADNMLEVLCSSTAHRYLGRHVCGSAASRGEVELKHRIAAGWARFHQHRQVLLNRDVSIRLRLKLFDATVSPTVLYGMSVLPLTQSQYTRLDAVQRRMLRNIVGWVRLDEEPWADTMRRMKGRVERALRQHDVRSWTTPRECTRGGGITVGRLRTQGC